MISPASPHACPTGRWGGGEADETNLAATTLTCTYTCIIDYNGAVVQVPWVPRPRGQSVCVPQVRVVAPRADGPGLGRPVGRRGRGLRAVHQLWRRGRRGQGRVGVILRRGFRGGHGGTRQGRAGESGRSHGRPLDDYERQHRYHHVHCDQHLVVH